MLLRDSLVMSFNQYVSLSGTFVCSSFPELMSLKNLTGSSYEICTYECPMSIITLSKSFHHSAYDTAWQLLMF